MKSVTYQWLSALLVSALILTGSTNQLPAQSKQEKPSAQSKPAAGDSEKSNQKQEPPKQSSPQAQEKNKGESRKSNRSSSRRSMFEMPWNSSQASKRDPAFVKIFEPVAASMKAATVRIMADKEQVALGTVVDSDGLILTKASELRPGMECVIGGKKLTPEVVGIHPESDLALLRVEAQSLNTIQWSDNPSPTLGHWVASPMALAKDMPAIGIIATENTRVIPPSRPFIGILMQAVKSGVQITEVIEKSPAKFAGLKKGDIITAIGDVKVKVNAELGREIRKYEVGDRVELTVLRKGTEATFKLTLAEQEKISPASQRSNQQNSMGSKLSRRRKNFPKAFQHDSMLNANTCGGPIVDLSGKVIGINIARDGRVSSLALPIDTVLPIIELLKSGDLSPEVVNKSKIELIEAELAEISKRIGKLPEKKNVLNVRYNRERVRLDELKKFSKDYKSRVEELNKLMADYKKRLKELEDRRAEVEQAAKRIKGDLDTIHGELRTNEKIKSQLERDLQRLRTGSSS